MIPITQGALKTNVDNMNIGDYIAARYVTTAMTAHGTFSEIGTVDTAAVPFFTSSALNGHVYLMKIAKGLLVCMSQLYLQINYATMNSANRIYGEMITVDSRNYLIRVPTINEYIKMCGTLDGKLSVADRYTNYAVNSATEELVQENYNISEGVWVFNTTPATISNASVYINPKDARLVLEFAEDSKCTDLYH